MCVMPKASGYPMMYCLFSLRFSFFQKKIKTAVMGVTLFSSWALPCDFFREIIIFKWLFAAYSGQFRKIRSSFSQKRRIVEGRGYRHLKALLFLHISTKFQVCSSIVSISENCLKKKYKKKGVKIRFFFQKTNFHVCFFL